jgi:uncharacterized protein GlcG (DUF336 family)
MRTTQTLDLNDAGTIIDAGIAEAERIGNPMNIAVVDAGGCLLAFARMDDAWRGSVDIAIGKAWTARAFDVETMALAKLAQPGADFYGIHASNDGKVMIFAGGGPYVCLPLPTLVYLKAYFHRFPFHPCPAPWR